MIGEQRVTMDFSEKEVREGDEILSVLHTRFAKPGLIENATNLLRSNLHLSSVELQAKDGNRVVARRVKQKQA